MANTPKTRWTADELLTTSFPEPPWIVPNLLTVGFGGLSGRPKLGKSLLSMRLALAVGSGGQFLGETVEKQHVLVLSLEDGPRRLQDRLQHMGAQSGTDTVFETSWPSFNDTGSGNPRNSRGIRELRDYIRANKPALVIIDTLSRAVSGKIDWNDLSAVTALLAPLQEMAHEEQTCIFPIDHMKKAGGFARDVVEDLLGSTAKSGVSDTLWGLYRKRGERSATLAVTGRDIEERELTIQWNLATWDFDLLGNGSTAATSTVQTEILDALADLGQATATELAVRLGKHRANITRELGDLVFKRRVRACKKIGNAQPYELVPEDPWVTAAMF